MWYIVLEVVFARRCDGGHWLRVYAVGIKGLYPLPSTDFAPFTELPQYVEIEHFVEVCDKS